MTKNLSVLITGCSTGIGFDTAITLSDMGYNVFATARKQSDVDKLKTLDLQAYQLDLMDETSIEQAFNWVIEQTGGELYALFNNGAYGQAGALEDLPSQALKEQFQTNVFGWHFLTTLVIPIMRKQGFGRIIQNSSVLGLVAMPYRGAYNASKFAIEGYTDTLRLELTGSGIQVILIEPGPIETQFRANALAKTREFIDVENSAHKENYKIQIDRLSKEEGGNKFTLPASAVTEKVIHALSSKKAKTRYYVTKPTYIMAFLKRILPFTWLDKILIKG
ncbi:SDR family oxidoreductase [Pseudocolwellia sp. AS88]|uniref:SDR family oxidoreductase n=1 Tax=Pseudocolwellia sp. AS88 TaxID=3063958 RepID=UPI0026EA65A6|nr:SDR family oxidoreductase [Pseudocolwellia sp. AS88]MDO7086391.1 SDR family oxidoreductase [Pseudocolwellia sp. AS88]